MKFHKLLNSFAAAVLTLSPIASSIVSATEAEYALTASSVSSDDEILSEESNQSNDVPETSPGLVEASEIDDENLLADLQAALDSSHEASASEADGNKIESLSAAWITPDSKPDGDINTLNRTWTNTSSEFVQLKINYALSGTHSYPAGAVRITVPKRIFKNRGGQWTGRLTQAVPESPDRSALFAYSQTDDTVTLTNTKTLAAATSGIFEMTFRDLSPFDIKDMSSGYVTEAFTPRIEVTTKNGTVISKTSSNSLKAKIDTSATLEAVRLKNTGISEGWNDFWPSELKPADSESNVYTTWQSETRLTANQIYNLSISNASFSSTGRTRTARILGYKINSTGQIIQGSPNGKQLRSNSDDLNDSYVTYYVSYPSSDFPTRDTYTLGATVTSSLTPVDDRNTQTKSDSAEINYTPYKFIPPTGHFYGRKDGSGPVVSNFEGHYSMHLNRLRTGNPTDITYIVQSGGFGYKWTQTPNTDKENPDNFGKIPYTLEVEDYNVTLDGENTLSPGDYSFKSLEIGTVTAYSYEKYKQSTQGYFENVQKNAVEYGDINKGQYGYLVKQGAFNDATLAIYGSVNGGEYMKYADVTFNNETPTITAKNGASVDGTKLTFPDNVTQWKTVTTTKAAAALYAFIPTMTIKSTAKVKRVVENLFNNSDTPTTKVANTVRSTLDSQHGRADLNIWKPIGIDHLEGVATGVSASKSLTYDDSVKLRKATLHYSAKMKYETNLSSEEDVKQAVQEGLITEEKSGTWYDLLPKGVSPITRSVTGRKGDKVESVEAIRNYKNTGRTLLKVKMSLSPDYNYQSESSSTIGHEGYYDAPEIHFDANYSYDDMSDHGKNLVNYVVYQSNNNSLIGSIIGHKGEPDNPLAGNNDKSRAVVGNFADALTNLDPTTDNPSFVYAKDETALAVDLYALTSLTKTVDVNNENDFGSGLDEEFAKNVYGNSVYKYRLRVKNPDDSESRNIRFFDKIESYTPTADDTYDYKDAQWKGTLQGVDISELEAKGVKPIVYYSTKKNIVLDDTDNRADNDLSNRSVWSTTMPADKSSITAVAIDASKKADGSPFTLEANGSLQAYLIMRSPEIRNDEVVDKKLAPDESEAGMSGGSHAYNDSVMISTSLRNGKVVSNDLLVRNGYTKVGLKPYRLHVKKQWDDGNNRDGVRPSSIKMHLVANGKRTNRSVVLNEGNEWTARFDNLEYIGTDGFPISYSVDEDVPSKYTFSKGIAELVSDGLSYKVSNFHEPEKITIKGVKSWRGDDPTKRPKSVQLTLYGNEERVRTIQVTDDMDWNYAFENVYKNEKGRPITYSVKEEYVDDYRSHVTGHNIENEYYPYGDITLTKRVKNATSVVANKQFEFTLLIKKDNGDPDSDSYKYETTDGRRGSISNGGKITLQADQSVTVKDIHSKYSYEWVEKIEDGFESTSENAKGTVKSIPNPKTIFTNTYVTTGSVVLRGRKVLQNRKQEPYQFTFDLLTENNQLLRAATNDANGEIYFGSLQYSNEDAGRTYRYKIRERNLGERGYTYDRHEDIVTVRVIDNGDGTMTATPTYDNDGATFTNTYNATGEIRLTAYKSMKYAVQKAAAGEFNFELVNENNQVVATGSNDADGVIAFTSIRINQSHIGKTLTFTGREKRGTDGNTNYDLSTVTYKVRVSDAGDGTLNYDVIEQIDNKPEGNDSRTPTFTNSRKDGSLKISKEATGGDANDEFRFRVTLEGLDDTTVTNGSELSIERGNSERVSTPARTRRSLPDEIFEEATDSAETPTASQTVNLGEQWDTVQGTWDSSTSILDIEVLGKEGTLDKAKFRNLTFLNDIKQIRFTNANSKTLYLPKDSSYLFSSMKNLTNIENVNYLNTSNVVNMISIFVSSKNLISLDLNRWNTSNVIYMKEAFNFTKSLTNLNISNWDTSHVTNMSGMFSYMDSLVSLDISNWDTRNVIEMQGMFQGDYNLTSLDISNWNTSNVQYMYSMFYGASSLKTLDMSRWDIRNVKTMSYTFNGATNLTTLITPAITQANNLLLDNVPELYNQSAGERFSSTSLQKVQSSQTWVKEKPRDVMFYPPRNDETHFNPQQFSINSQGITGQLSVVDKSKTSPPVPYNFINASKLNVSNANHLTFNNLLPAELVNYEFYGLDMSFWTFSNRPTNISNMFRDKVFTTGRTDNFLKWPESSKLIAGNMSNMFKGVTGSQVIDITGLDTRQATNTANALDLGNNNRIEKLILGEHSLLKKDMFGDLSRYNGYVWTHSSGKYGPWTTEELVNKYVGGSMQGEFVLSQDTRVVVKTIHPKAITSAQSYETRLNSRTLPEINKVLTSQVQQNTRDYEFLGYGYAFAQTDGTVGNYAEKLIDVLPDSNESRAFLTQFIEFLKSKKISTTGLNANKASLAKMRQAIQGSEFTSLSDAFNKFASAKPDLKSTFVALINKGASHSAFASANPVTFTSIWAPKRNSVTLSNNSFEITMKRGESVTIKGLPANVKYSIEELPSPGYSVKNSVNTSGTIPSNSTAKAFFENEYNPGKTSVQLRAKKQFEHNSRPVNGYQFEITPLNGAPGTKHTVNSDDAGIAQFNKVEFARVGTYKYKVREIAGSDSNIQYDSSQKEITVNVTSVQGRMTANVVNDAPIFTNRLKKGSIVVSKRVTGHQNPNADTFTFELIGDAGRTKERFTLKNGQSKTFSDLPYGSRYEIREINIPAGYKPSQANTSVIVSQARHDVSITNAFEYEGSVNLAAKKVLNGRKLQSGEFTFEVVDSNNKVVATTTNSADGTIAFDAIKITQPGTTTFKIREVRPTNTMGVVYDTHEEVVTVRSSVIDRTNGLASTVTYSSESPTFTNTVNPPTVDNDTPYISNERDVTIRKTIDGVTDGNKDIPFTVKVSITRNNVPVTRLYRLEGTRQTSSSIAHGQTFTIKHDEVVTIKKIPVGTRVVIEEVVPEGYTLDRSSKTALTVNSAAVQPTMTLINNYRASGEWQPTVRKTLRNSTLQDNQFRFVMTKNGKVVQRVTNKADGSVPFAPEYYTLDDVGKTYNYEIFESNDRADKIRYDKSVHRISVTVTDDGYGHIIAQADTNSVGFVNVYDRDLPATGTLGAIASVITTIALLGVAFYLNKLRKRA